MLKFIIARDENGNDHFQSHLNHSLIELGSRIQYDCIYNREASSIFDKYNIGISRYKADDLKDDDVLVFSHADIKILDKHFIEKVEMVFNKKPEVGMLGVIGTTVYDGNGWWTNSHDLHCGQISQGLKNKQTYQMIRKIGYFDDICVLDGCIFMIRGSLINQGLRFDEKTYPNSYHMYDYDMSLTVLQKGYRVAVADIGVEHASEGPLGESWQMNNKRLRDKWTKKGYQFPLKASDIIPVINTVI